MLLPSEIDKITDVINSHFVILEDELIGEIADRISKVGYANIVSLNQANILNQMGLLNNDIYNKLVKATEKTEDDIKKIMNEAMITSFKRDNIIFSKELVGDLKISEGLMQTLKADVSRLNFDLNNLTGTTAMTTQTQFLDAVNRAHLEVISGAKSYTSAMIDAIDRIGNNGIDVLYPSGHRDKVEVATRRAIMTSVNQTNGELQLQRCQELGWDLVEVSAHYGARPTHAEWQGQVYSLTGSNGYKNFYEETEYGTMLGLCGINCRHTFYPYYEGSKLTYTKKELDEINNKKVWYNGRQMTYYQATQYQRYLERSIRKCTRQIEGNKQLLINDKDVDINQVKYSIKNLQAKQNGIRNELAEFTKQVGLKESNRLYTIGKEVKLYKNPNIKNALFTNIKKSSMVTNLIKSNTFEEAKKNLENFAMVVKDNISKIRSIDALDIVSNTLQELTDKYGTEKLRIIGSFTSQKSNARANGHILELNSGRFSSLKHEKTLYSKEYKENIMKAISNYEQWIKEAEISLERYKGDYYMESRIKKDIKSYKKLVKEYSERVKFDRWSLSSSYSDEESLRVTVIHEYGHIIADQYMGQLNGRACTKNYIYTDEMRSLNDEVKDIYKRAKESGDIYLISNYADENVKEFFAESFAMYNVENEKLPNYIKDMIEKVVKYGKSM